MADNLFARVTPYYAHHIALGAQMMEKGGWIRPSLYTDVEDEVNNTRNNVGIIDVHSMGKFEVVGNDAFTFMQYVMTNDLNRIKKGKQGIYTCFCNDDGGIVDDVIVYYISDKRFYFITNTVSRERVGCWLREAARRRGFLVQVIDVTNAVAYLAIQGPKSKKLIVDMFGGEVDKLEYFEFLQLKLGNISVLLARTGYTGEVGYELNYPSEYAFMLWEYIIRKGEKYGIKPVGGLTLQVMRSEKGYRSYGTDMNEDNNPFEAGLQWNICFDKAEFIGKSALRKIKEMGVLQQLKGFILEKGSMPQKGTKLFIDNQEAGFVTTCYKSPTLGCIIGMGMIYKQFWNQKKFEALSESIIKIVSMPFYDKNNEKLRL